MKKAKLGALVIVGLMLGGVAGARGVHGRGDSKSAETSGSVAATTLVVPRAETPIVVDGELTEPAWTTGAVARTGAFSQRPYSDARLAWRSGVLYLGLYAADEDLRATDAHHDEPLWLADSYSVTFRNGDRQYVIEVSPAGVMTDMQRTRGGVFDTSWESGATVALDRDGTVNEPSDNDEEWVAEMAVPLKSLGLEGKVGERIGLTIQRCDLSRGSTKRACATWGERGEVIELAP